MMLDHGYVVRSSVIVDEDWRKGRLVTQALHKFIFNDGILYATSCMPSLNFIYDAF